MRVLLIGFDGADWNLMNEFIREGILPNFSNLARNGLFLPLKSTTPPISPPAWASIVTGVNPGKHGVYEFIEFDKEKFQKKVRFNPIRVKKIWNYLDEAGYRSIVVNFPLMYPPEKINGITISGLMTPSSAKYFTYPKQLTEELKEKGYEVEISEVELFKLLYSDKERLFNRLIQMMKKRAEISLELLKQEDWDFSMIVFGETDRIQHFFWNEKTKIKRCYIEMDKVLGQFIKQIVDSDTVLMVVSDHGFRSIKKYFYINSWLHQKGLLSFKNGKAKSMSVRDKILRVLSKLHLEQLVNYVPEFLARKIPDSKIHLENIDVEKTKAYCWSGYGYLMLNDDLSPEDKTKLKEELLRITDPESGERVIKNVFEKEEIFSGKYLDSAPDLILIPNNGYFFQDKYLSENLFDKPENSPGLAKRYGEHSDLGIFFIFNNHSIKELLRLKNIKKLIAIYDITPIILNPFKIPIPKHMDGGFEVM